MDYRPIISFDPKWVTGMLDYFVWKNNNMLESLQYIENKSSTIQKEFDIGNPNITLYIGDYVFDKDTESVQMDNNISLELNGNNCIFNSASSPTSIYDDTVLHKDDAELSKEYLSEYFLDKSVFSNNVNWGYDLSELAIGDSHIFNDNDILPYSSALKMFYLTQKENFKTLTIESEDETVRSGVVTYGTLKREMNGRDSLKIEADPKKVIGDTIEVSGDSVYLVNDAYIHSDTLSFKSGYIFHEDSPISIEYANSKYIRNDLDGVTGIHVSEKDITDRSNYELITEENLGSELTRLLDANTTEVSDYMTVTTSSGNNAINFKSLHNVLESKLTDFYSQQMRLFLSDYSGGSTIEEMIKYIISKIDELKENYVVSDECTQMQLDNINEGCDIICEKVASEEDNLMITKQRLKATIRCSLSCGVSKW